MILIMSLRVSSNEFGVQKTHMEKLFNWYHYSLQTLLTSTELYKVIAIEAINDDRFLNMVGALGMS